MSKKEKKVNDVYVTSDYEIFKDVAGNRQKDPKHIRELINSIQEENLLHANPITINENGEVIDGQHRLEAAKALGEAVYFIVVRGLRADQMPRLNSRNTTWKPVDYMWYYVNQGNKEYERLAVFIDKTKLPLSQSVALLQGIHAHSGQHMKSYKAGNFRVSDEKRAYYLANCIRWFSDYTDLNFRRSFVSAFVRLCKTEGFNWEQFKKNFEMQQSELVPCVNTGGYIKILEKIYNYRSRHPLYIKL